MNRFERRKLKQNIYKHANAIMYTLIFFLASMITVFAAVQRNNDVEYVDQQELSIVSTESIDVKNGESVKVAASKETTTIIEETSTVEETTVEETVAEETAAETEAQEEVSGQIRITADTLTVRADASQDADTLGLVDEGDVFDVISRNGEWIQIEYQGQTGYVNAEFVQDVE
ncbi:MAG: SH3 domain-containing protein [Eubacterium sp.]|nr:SH3 domain-containing protein [Eubacterium sp.]